MITQKLHCLNASKTSRRSPEPPRNSTSGPRRLDRQTHDPTCPKPQPLLRTSSTRSGSILKKTGTGSSMWSEMIWTRRCKQNRTNSVWCGGSALKGNLYKALIYPHASTTDLNKTQKRSTALTSHRSTGSYTDLDWNTFMSCWNDRGVWYEELREWMICPVKSLVRPKNKNDELWIKKN